MSDSLISSERPTKFQTAPESLIAPLGSPTAQEFHTAPSTPLEDFSSEVARLGNNTKRLLGDIERLKRELKDSKAFCTELIGTNEQLVEKNSKLEKNSTELRKSNPVSISVERAFESQRIDSEDSSLIPKTNGAQNNNSDMEAMKPSFKQFVIDETDDNNDNDDWITLFYRRKRLSPLHVLLFLLTTYLIIFLFAWLLFRCSTVATDNYEKDFMKKNYCTISDDFVTKIFTNIYNDCPLTANYLADNYTCYPEIYQHIKGIVQESYERTRLIEITQKRYLLALSWVDTEPFLFNSDCDRILYYAFNASVTNVTVYNRNVFMPLVILGLEKDSIDLMYKHIYIFCKNLKVIRPDASVHILFISAYGHYPFHMPRNNSLFSTFNLYPVKTANETHFWKKNVVEAVENTWPLFAKKLLSPVSSQFTF